MPSMISKGDYSVCKCAMNRDRMVKVLVRFFHEKIGILIGRRLCATPITRIETRVFTCYIKKGFLDWCTPSCLMLFHTSLSRIFSLLGKIFLCSYSEKNLKHQI